MCKLFSKALVQFKFSAMETIRNQKQTLNVRITVICLGPSLTRTIVL